MPTLKDCYKCRKKIGVASKMCLHCSAKQPYKQKLEEKKKQLSQEWKERQKKNSSVNKVYDGTNLLLHKWQLLERYPVLLLAKRTLNGFSAECFCPWKMETEDAQDAFVTIKRLYESLLNVAIAEKATSRVGETPATTSRQTETPPINNTADPASESTPLLPCNEDNSEKAASSTVETPATTSRQTETPPINNTADPASESTPLLPCNVDNSEKAASSTVETPATTSRQTETPPIDNTADPASESTPLLHPESETPASSSLASPISFTNSLSLSVAPSVSHPDPSPISSSLASSLPPASILSASSKLNPVSTELGSPDSVSYAQKKRKIKRKTEPKECPIHKDSTSFPYKKILRKRIREGHAEVLVQWHPCSGCGMKWKNTWEPQGNIQSSS